MSIVVKGGAVFVGGKAQRADVLIRGGVIADIGDSLAGDVLVDAEGLTVFPGLVDVHVHFREPGFSYKETILSGSAAAAAGGYTAVCAMPNLNPAPDCAENLDAELNAIRETARCRVVPYGTITKGRAGREVSDMRGMAGYVAGFSDDGSGVMSEGVMRRAMHEARRLHKIIAAHCEDTRLIPKGASCHDGEFARKRGLTGIPSSSEWRQVERDLRLVRETGCAYHVCHVSTRETVALIRAAKKSGLDVTCETAPHYLLMDDTMLENEGRFKMNPPIRAREDREALVIGMLDGTIDMLATDHAPHSADEKAGDFNRALMGVVGLECAFPIMYEHMVLTGIITLEKLIDIMSINPGRRFILGGEIDIGAPANLAAFDLDYVYSVNPETFLSKGRATPFAGWRARGRCAFTVAGDRVTQNEKRQPK